MSMRPDFQNRDWSKKPLKRSETQIDAQFNEETDAGKVQQNANENGRLEPKNIVASFFQTGVISHTRDATARYIDATAITDFREAMTVKARADQAYSMLPAEVKKEFKTQQDFVKFASDEKNLDKLREWGLAAPLKVPHKADPIEVIVKNPEEKTEA